MSPVIKVVAGILLLAHGLVFLLYLVTEPDDPNFPFTFDKSPIVPETGRRSVGISLMIATIILFALLALAVWGVPGLAGIWPLLAITASLVSLVLLVLFWQTQLIFGVVIAAALITIAFVRPGWTDTIG